VLQRGDGVGVLVGVGELVRGALELFCAFSDVSAMSD
jgi:hypothetical protein